MRGLTVRVEGIDRRQNGAGIVHILKFYGFYEVVYVIPWLGASFAKSCGTPVYICNTCVDCCQQIIQMLMKRPARAPALPRRL